MKMKNSYQKKPMKKGMTQKKTAMKKKPMQRKMNRRGM